MTLPDDLRLRLVSTFLVVLAISQLQHLPVAAVALFAVVLVTLGAGQRAVPWRRYLHVEIFVLLLLLSLPFSVPGTTLWTFGPLELSAEGLARALLVAAKVSACALLLLTALNKIEPERLGAALHALKVPDKLVQLLMLTVRYLSLLRTEGTRLHDAMRARAFAPGSNRHTWRSYGNLIGMLLVRALERAERVEEAMRCRAYSGRFPHASLTAPPRRDWWTFSLLSALALGLVVMLSLIHI